MSYVYGYVDIEVEGYYIERFINICASKGIYLWKTKRNKSTIFSYPYFFAISFIPCSISSLE